LVVFISAFMALILSLKCERRCISAAPSDALFAGEGAKVKQIRHFPDG
jgi:hypothetical protein